MLCLYGILYRSDGYAQSVVFSAIHIAMLCIVSSALQMAMLCKKPAAIQAAVFCLCDLSCCLASLKKSSQFLFLRGDVWRDHQSVGRVVIQTACGS